MGKLSLVIADTDADYVRNLEKYLIENHAGRFEICSFTAPEYVRVFLERGGKRTDVLLLGRGFDAGILPREMYKVAVRLAEETKAVQMKPVTGLQPCQNRASAGMETGDGNSGACGSGGDGTGCGSSVKPVETVGKYQHIEGIIADIYRIFAQVSRESSFTGVQKNVSVICFFSPSGGCGKTAIAAHCSKLCARRGLKCFYLNLEDVSSETMHFAGTSTQNLSSVIYYLKEKRCNLAMRIEGAKCTDAENGVSFFLPPECPSDLDALSPEELLRLIGCFREAALYDAVFVDMQGGLTAGNMELLKAADTVVQIYSADQASQFKFSVLKSEQDVLRSKYALDLAAKSVFVLNRHTAQTGEAVEAQYQHFIPEFREPVRTAEGRRRYCSDPGFISAVERLLDSIIPFSKTPLSGAAGGKQANTTGEKQANTTGEKQANTGEKQA